MDHNNLTNGVSDYALRKFRVVMLTLRKQWTSGRSLEEGIKLCQYRQLKPIGRRISMAFFRKSYPKHKYKHPMRLGISSNDNIVTSTGLTRAISDNRQHSFQTTIVSKYTDNNGHSTFQACWTILLHFYTIAQHARACATKTQFYYQFKGLYFIVLITVWKPIPSKH